jgi:hypothetical protein
MKILGIDPGVRGGLSRGRASGPLGAALRQAANFLSELRRQRLGL